MIGTPVIGNDVEGGWVGMPPKAWHNPPLPGLRLPRRSLLRRPRDTMATRSRPVRSGSNCQSDVPLRCYYYLVYHYQAKGCPGWLEDYLQDYLDSSRERLGEAPGTLGRVGTRDSERLRKGDICFPGFLAPRDRSNSTKYCVIWLWSLCGCLTAKQKGTVSVVRLPRTRYS